MIFGETPWAWCPQLPEARTLIEKSLERTLSVGPRRALSRASLLPAL